MRVGRIVLIEASLSLRALCYCRTPSTPVRCEDVRHIVHTTTIKCYTLHQLPKSFSGSLGDRLLRGSQLIQDQYPVTENSTEIQSNTLLDQVRVGCAVSCVDGAPPQALHHREKESANRYQQSHVFGLSSKCKAPVLVMQKRG